VRQPRFLLLGAPRLSTPFGLAGGTVLVFCGYWIATVFAGVGRDVMHRYGGLGTLIVLVYQVLPACLFCGRQDSPLKVAAPLAMFYKAGGSHKTSPEVVVVVGASGGELVRIGEPFEEGL